MYAPTSSPIPALAPTTPEGSVSRETETTTAPVWPTDAAIRQLHRYRHHSPLPPLQATTSRNGVAGSRLRLALPPTSARGGGGSRMNHYGKTPLRRLGNAANRS